MSTYKRSFEATEPASKESGEPVKRHHGETSSVGTRKPLRKKWIFKPFSRTPPLQPDSKLCLRCQSIDFKAIFEIRNIGINGVPVFDLGSSKSFDENCFLCNIFVSKTQHIKRFYKPSRWNRRKLLPDRWHLRVYSPLSIFGLKHNNSKSRRQLGSIMTLYPRAPVARSNGYYERAILDSSFIIPVLQLDSDGGISDPAFRGRRLSPNIANYGALRLLLAECVETHSCSKVPQDAIQEDIRVIDCVTRFIVPLPSNCNYICLSYVWGKDQLPTQLESRFIHISQKLPQNVPKTIDDSILVVLALNEKYLWVDRYCIDQYHSETKTNQIAAMADIYENALLTIVALGSSSSSGLAGVSSVKRRPQHLVVSDHTEFIVTSPSLQECLELSAWSYRAWTYQEALLSRRCIYFTDWQAFFVCKLGTYSEDIVDLGPLDLRQLVSWSACYLNPSIISSQHIFAPERAPHSDSEECSFRVQLRTYRSRELSYQTDVLDAFRGLLARTDYKTFWGVPVYKKNDWLCGSYYRGVYFGTNLTHGFVTGLLWTHPHHQAIITPDPSARHAPEGPQPSNLSRRETFPSWSWTSVRTPIELIKATTSFDLTYYPSTVRYCSDVLVPQDGQPGVLEFQEFCQGCPNTILPEVTRCLQFKTYLIHWSVPAIHGFALVDDLDKTISGESVVLKRMDKVESNVSDDWGYHKIFWDPEAANERTSIFEGRKTLSSNLLLGTEGNGFLGWTRLSADLPVTPDKSCALTLYWLAVTWTGDYARRVGIVKSLIRPGYCLSDRCFQKGTYSVV